MDSAEETTVVAKGTVVSSGTGIILDSFRQAAALNNPVTSKAVKAKRRGPGKIQVATTTARRVLPARKGKKVAASAESVLTDTAKAVPVIIGNNKVASNETIRNDGSESPMVVNVDELDFPPASTANHLFLFPEGATGEEKFMAIMSSDYVLDKKYEHEVAFYIDPDIADFPVMYKDFVRLRDKQFTTTHVVSAFFHLMDREFRATGNHQRFADCSLWCNYILQQDSRSPDRLTAAFYKYFMIGEDKQLYIPMMVNNNHYMLVVILFDELSIEVYDSLDFNHENEVAKILSFLKVIFDRDLPWFVSKNSNNHLNIPRQSDGYSCAFYASWYAFIHAWNGCIPRLPNDRTISDIARGVFISLLENKLYDKLLYVE